MNRGRKRLIVLLLMATFSAGLARSLVYSHRQSIQTERRRTAGGLQGLDSFALGLILGGLRGPLVMFLWTSIESQKTEKNLENIDTKIELVRMLQPEFASVHIFQIWNKAYNLSVQMASLPNKYSMILSALQYAHSVDAEQRDNLNIISALAETYAQKLAQSQEADYYVMRVRQDSLARPIAPGKNPRRDIAWQLTRHEPLLDEKGFLLPKLLEPRADRPRPRPGSTMVYDGSELQYLGQFNTPEAGGFPYGVSPDAIGYNYYKRAAALMDVTGQKHLYTSDGVVDSRPGIVLRHWADEEMERGRRNESTSLGKASPADRWELEPITATMPPNSKMPAVDEKTRKAVAEALFSYRRAGAVANLAAREFDEHARRDFGENPQQYLYHMDTARGMAAMAAADHAYFHAMAAANGLAGNPATTATLIDMYNRALEQFYYAMLGNDVEDEIVAAVYPTVAQLPGGKRLNKATLHEIDPKFYAALYKATVDEYRKRNRLPALDEAIREYSAYITRAQQRVDTLKG